MTVVEAREKNICRICGGPSTAPFMLEYGDEFAHQDCLEGKTPRPGTPVHSLGTPVGWQEEFKELCYVRPLDDCLPNNCEVQ